MFFLFGPLTLLILLAGSCIYVWLRWRRLRTNTITNALALLVGQNLPLVEGLRAMAAGERGGNRRVLHNIAGNLSVGDSIATAVRAAYRSIPGDVLGAIQAGEEAGTLKTVLHNIDRRVRSRTLVDMGTSPTLAYAALILLILTIHVFAVATFLLPKFRDIFADFGVTTLPWQTELLLSCVNTAHNELGILLPLLILSMPLLLLQFLVGRYFIVRVPDRVQPLFRVIDALSWSLPGLRRAAQTRAMARQLPILAASVRGGHNLPDAVQHAALTDANWFARRRLYRWAQRMKDGVPPAEAAREARIPAPLCGVLAKSRSHDELSAELSYLSTYYERLAFHWERILAGLFSPLITLCVSVLVGAIAVALYMPLRGILDSILLGMY